MKSHLKISVCVILFLSFTLFTSFGRSVTEERTKIIYTDRDSYIDSYSTDSNYGGQDYLCIGELLIGYDHTYLHFDLSEIPEEFTKASLSLDCYYLPETIDISIYSTSSTWNEYSLTWINAPSEGSLVGHFINLGQSKVYRFIVTNFMKSWSSSQISFIVKEYDFSETGYIQISSREGAYYDSDRPQLIFYYDVEVDIISPIIAISIVSAIGISIGIGVFLYNKKKKSRKIQEELKAKTFSPYSISQTTCSNCGAEIIPSGTFCTNCGKKLSQNHAS